MDRLACLELRAFPLQLFLRDHPEARGEPAAVIERDVPHGILTWVNDRARAAGVLPGLRYSAALGACRTLRTAVVGAAEIERGVARIVQELQRFSPHVEPCADEPGVFWLDARGLKRLHGTPRAWAARITAHLRTEGFEAHVAVGFRHFASYAAVKALEREPIAVFQDPTHESRVAAGVGLARLPIDADARDALAKLGVTHLAAFARLPAGGVLQRFGPTVHRLQRLACGAFHDELAPVPEWMPVAAHVELELPNGAKEEILQHCEELARPLCAALARNGEATAALTVRLQLERRARDGAACPAIEERVRPAAPTCDLAWLMRLVRMRLDDLVLARGVTRIDVTLERMPAPLEQATLFAAAKGRSARAAQRAFSALRALYGDDAVVCAFPASAHLPEHSFTWERCDEPAVPRPSATTMTSLVRRLCARPIALPPRPRREPDGWLLLGLARGPVVRLTGPHRLSGGWWRSEVERDYYYAELADGEIAWIYHDGVRRRWFLQGTVT